MAYKIIESVTFSETAFSNRHGDELPEANFSIYHMPTNYAMIGHRFAIYLQSQQIKLADNEKITLVLSSYLDSDTIEVADRRCLDGARHITVGVNPTKFNALSEDDKRHFLLKTLFHAFMAINPYPDQEEALTEAYHKVKEADEDLEIVYKIKEDQNLQIQLILKVKNTGMCDLIISAVNHKNEVLDRKHLSTEHCFSAALQRCGNILIRKDKIIIKPVRNIFNADLKPIEVPYPI